MRVLLTGAGGFIGRRLLTDMVNDGRQVFALRRAPPPAGGDFPGCDWIAADLAGDLSALPGRIDAVVHFAAASPAPGVAAAQLVRDNVTATQNLLRWALAAGAERFIYASSTSLYGRVETDVLTPDTPSRDPDVYGASKLLGERLLAAAADRLPTLALRLPGVIGPGCRGNFLSNALRRLMRHEEVRAFNPDAPFNNAVATQELGRFVAGLLRRPLSGFDAVTLGAGGAITVGGALARMAQACGSRSVIAYDPPRQRAFTISSARAAALYGYAPGDIGDMLDRFVADLRDEAGRHADGVKPAPG